MQPLLVYTIAFLILLERVFKNQFCILEPEPLFLHVRAVIILTLLIFHLTN